MLGLVDHARKSRRHPISVAGKLTACMIVVMISTFSAIAQDAPLPKAEEVLDQYITETGGAEAYQKLTSMKVTASLEVVGTDQRGTIMILKQAPAKMMRKETINGAESVKVTDGTNAWIISEMEGTRLMEGAEKEQFMRKALFNAELHWRKLYEKVECTGEATIEGTACYVLALTGGEGEPETRFYAKDSGLLLRTLMTVNSIYGPLPLEIGFSGYKLHEGVKGPSFIKLGLGGTTIETSIDTQQYNVTIPDSTFDLPVSLKKGP